MKVTLKEVSKYCGLSIATVSNVLNGTKPVTENNKRKVLKAVQDLEYIPHEAARQLKAGKSGLIGVLTVGYNSFFTEILKGVEEQATRKGFKIIVGSTEEDVQSQKEFLDSFIAKRVEGIIMAPANGWTKEKLKKYQDIPIALIDRWIPAYKYISVITNNKESSKQLVSHLATHHQYKHIGLVYAYSDISSMTERKLGYEIALREARIPIENSFMESCDGSIEGAEEATIKLIEKNKDLEAIYIANNNMLLGAFKACKKRKLKIPQDIAIAGVDTEPWMEFVQPTITTIQQPVKQMGREAMNLLINNKDNKYIQHEELKNKVVIGESCGC
ncbi:LacI family DNA-binding transcriptional regulator [Halobacillus ihumii]|uniref:LacI family DNA-binding transcriptional regulator n=1 Tax=Halobacillus ihumii TaxID=2686092 RepID=UPI0013D53EA6|nr:LacI family DNA-binding transcriptional regulator [Halobacillus ihumii]